MFWLKFSIGLSLMCTVAAQICGNGIVEAPFEECDDDNVDSNDGCSSLCKVESIAYMTWYNSSDCTGKVVKQQIFNDREYLVSKDFRATLRWRTGICAGGMDCDCRTPEPTCYDGSDSTNCICERPMCSEKIGLNNPEPGPGASVKFDNPPYLVPRCREWKLGLVTGRKYSFIVTCNAKFPRLSTKDESAVSGAFVIFKHWRLTKSSLSITVGQTADEYAWETTRARAIGSTTPDYWEVISQKTCVPSYSTLLPEDKVNVYYEKADFEYHDPVTQLVKYGCSDDTCKSCKIQLPMSQAACNQSALCQILAPGRCFACSGGLTAKPLEGFEVWPGPPAPRPYRCVPCSQAPTNYFYATTECRTGRGCGACGSDLPAWPVTYWPGLACGACAQKDAPLTACGDQRQGGLPYFWVNAHHDLKSGSLQEAHLLAHAPLTPASSYYGSTSKDGVYTDALTEARPLDEAEVLVRQSFKGGHKSSQKQHVFDK